MHLKHIISKNILITFHLSYKEQIVVFGYNFEYLKEHYILKLINSIVDVYIKICKKVLKTRLDKMTTTWRN